MTIFACEMTRIGTDDVRWKFGDESDMTDAVVRNKDDYWCNVRPAAQDDFERGIAKLQEDRAYISLRHDVSPWGMGSKYRAQIADIDREISRLCGYLSDITDDSLSA